MALGDIWLATANGDCSQAGTCANGPCGPGENTESDCPHWTNTKSIPITYTPGGSVRVGGVTINPGETVRFLRGDIAPARQYEYPVEIFRASDGWTNGGVPVTITDDPRNVLHSNYATTLALSTTSVEESFGPYQFGNLTSTVMSADGYLLVAGWYKVANAFFGSPKWLWGAGYSYRYSLVSGPYPSRNALLDARFVRETTSSIDFLKWGVETYPAPKGVAMGSTVFSSIPESPGAEHIWPWGATTAVDAITLITNPTAAFSGSIKLTIRSACEDPAP